MRLQHWLINLITRPTDAWANQRMPRCTRRPTYLCERRAQTFDHATRRASPTTVSDPKGIRRCQHHARAIGTVGPKCYRRVSRNHSVDVTQVRGIMPSYLHDLHAMHLPRNNEAARTQQRARKGLPQMDITLIAIGGRRPRHLDFPGKRPTQRGQSCLHSLRPEFSGSVADQNVAELGGHAEGVLRVMFIDIEV